MKPIASRLLAWGGVIVLMTLLPLAAPAADQHDQERQQSGNNSSYRGKEGPYGCDGWLL